MNDTTLEKLEFDRIREVLAARCGTALGKALARSMSPSTKTKIVRLWLEQVREMIALVESRSLPPLGGVHDITEYVRASAFPAPLEADALADVADTLGATKPLREWFDRIAERAPSLGALERQVHDLSSVADTIHQAIDPKGGVRDYASNRLASIRGAIDKASRSVRGVFDRFLRKAGFTRMLQYAGATFHNDRMVLPLKAEHRGRIPGIIHRSSDTGATLFVEPAESVELNNSIVRLKEQESKEITRILQELTRHVQEHARGILVTLRAIAVLDLIAAKSRYALERKCVCAKIDDKGVIDLYDARHPLLIELFDEEKKNGGPLRKVVPIDVRLGDDFDVLVVTGPNTGGKTVTLKTVGLLVLLNQCGVPIPAGAGSRMPVFKDVFVDIGDEQSLQQSLSTFSSHLANQLEILRQSGPRTLVLIDELGAGTDPDEGAAIGEAIVCELIKLRAMAMVTTHISALKAIAFNVGRVDNAAVEFDPETLGPTFHLRLGEPGNSNALIIAKRLGMPARLVQQAKWHLADRTRALNKAIAGTVRSRRDAEEARRTARDAALDAQKERDKYEKERAALEQSQLEFETWTKWVNDLSPGDPVYLKSLRRAAKVVRMKLHNQRALVSSGALDIEVPITDIVEPGADV